jgi:anti-anti-sigma regulatory factor
MSGKSYVPMTKADEAERVRLAADANYADLARLLNDCAQRECYRICMDANAVLHLGTVEFRVLGSFADEFKRRGGFLKLEHVNANVAALVREFGRTDLLRPTPA